MRSLFALAAGLWLSAIVPAASFAEREPDLEPSRCADHDPERNAYFGDLHVHTIFSLDASTQDTRTRPADAYRFAKGERIGIQPFSRTGAPMRHIRLSRPLDFAAVTDHAELLGEWNICNSPDLPGHDSWVCSMYRHWPRAAYYWMNYQASQATRHDFCGEGGRVCLEAARAPWQEIQEAAEAHQDRSPACRFTTFPGYEWTGGVGEAGNNFHRNVIFRSREVPALPASFIDAPRLDQLRERLDRECRSAGTGCDALVIPHNSNLGGGLMFARTRPDGSPLTRADAEARNSWEPLVEIMQHKGDSECHPAFSSEDELCGFEKLPTRNFRSRTLDLGDNAPVARQFVRRILLEGLEAERSLGANPFRYGIIASTDTHLGAAGLAEESADYPGHGGAGTPVGDSLPQGLPDSLDFNPGGLAVLWAEENSRDALFAAMRRRESYGTSGPRIVVRFFGGWEIPEDLCAPGRANELVATGYGQGVPMGGMLPAPPSAVPVAPAFVVSALRDPGSASGPGTQLQRIQIVKGWLEGDELRERVFEVAGDPESGARVDLQSCEQSGPGFDQLCGVWRDADFDPSSHAFYYARVVENPTCRWSQKACNAQGVRCDDPTSVGEGLEGCCAEAHQPSIQERAWTSPIWHRPARGPAP